MELFLRIGPEVHPGDPSPTSNPRGPECDQSAVENSRIVVREFPRGQDEPLLNRQPLTSIRLFSSSRNNCLLI
jgi:hypothetical protein